ncbi:hypothetical protein IV102_12030, partial [bacterium]|nr:hypothetical protein [bacterium]
ASEVESQAHLTDANAATQSLAALVALLRQTGEALLQRLHTPQLPSEAAGHWTPAQLQAAAEILSRLRGQLQNCEGGSLESLNELQQAAPLLAQSGGLHRLQKLIHTFEFGPALEELQVVTQAIPAAHLMA